MQNSIAGANKTVPKRTRTCLQTHRHNRFDTKCHQNISSEHPHSSCASGDSSHNIYCDSSAGGHTPFEADLIGQALNLYSWLLQSAVTSYSPEYPPTPTTVPSETLFTSVNTSAEALPLPIPYHTLERPFINQNFPCSDKFTSKCLSIFQHVRETGAPNYTCARISLPQNLNMRAWRYNLSFLTHMKNRWITWNSGGP